MGVGGGDWHGNATLTGESIGVEEVVVEATVDPAGGKEKGRREGCGPKTVE